MINLHANSNLHLSSPEIRRKVVSKINYDELRLKRIESTDMIRLTVRKQQLRH